MKLVATLLCAALGCAGLIAQEAPRPESQSPPAASGAEKQSAPANPAATSKPDRPLPSFLILGSIFNENALSFPGVQVRIRRADEKKFRWETYTNSRGEFAVRVFPGHEYEVVTHVKKYKDQRMTVDGKVDVQQRLSIKLEPANQTTEGAKQ